MKKDDIFYNENGEKVKVISYYENDCIKNEAHFKNNQLHGTFKTYYEEGVLQSECELISGKINGKMSNYNKQGELVQDMFFVDGLLDGVFTNYKEQKIQIQIHFSKGIKHGQMIFYADNGNVKQIMNYENDMQTGESLVYDENSLELIQKCPYVKGKKHGTATIYFPNSNGKVCDEKKYENDLLEGFSTRYYMSGKVQQICEYKKGQQTGAPVYFDDEGKPVEDSDTQSVKPKKVGFLQKLFLKSA